MNRIDRGIYYAKKAALLSKHSRRVGAALFMGNKLVAVGWNSNKTHPKQKTYNNMQHAELNCLLGLHKLDVSKGTLYVVRVLKSGELAMSRPCEACYRFLKAAGLTHIYYSTEGSYEYYH